MTTTVTVVCAAVLFLTLVVIGCRIALPRVPRSGLIVTRYGLALSAHGRSIHVIPTGDGIGHTETEDCPCGPVHASAGDGYWLVEHQTSLQEVRR